MIEFFKIIAILIGKLEGIASLTPLSQRSVDNLVIAIFQCLVSMLRLNLRRISFQSSGNNDKTSNKRRSAKGNDKLGMA
jgi:hypothetical protein